jgi:hypothetical protein
MRMDHPVGIGPDMLSRLPTRLLCCKAAGVQPGLRQRIEALKRLVDDSFAVARMLALLLFMSEYLEGTMIEFSHVRSYGLRHRVSVRSETSESLHSAVYTSLTRVYHHRISRLLGRRRCYE